ncbi:protein farnesyltransferase subunit beta isoform X8 [Physeter macrocephalus]|uniref:Protein farnesyltransferase subunit beta n=1 Tax=Physeter macrocephalus TaxID=9755 RepID=A0A455C7A2_PHYMC|nr:protein farnesyltransferase subunit beta isoform X8 [Physeter catodon]|eukprot:XP_028351806.1 protein farnesyltransferase subunit beta isoform X8 [Physeter catodon]
MASPSSFTYCCPPSSSPVWSEPLYSLRPEHARERLQDDSVETVTSMEQAKVEEKIQEVFSSYKFNHLVPRLILQREKHFHYLKRGLRQLTDAYECLDASRPWLCYWILHSLELLDEPIPQMVATDVCQFLELCQSPEGGFGGGPGQYPHLAPTYAAVNALCIIGTEEAYDVINREKLLQYLYSLKQPDGSFLMHVGGEVDVRSAYCAASVASLTNIITPDLFEGTAEWIARCQNWEGGIGGVPGMEAHGGYTFCGLAALVILKKERFLNLKSLLQWVTGRQMRFEGGFQGRCNKLVDGCYSFWQAGLLPLLHRALHAQGPPGWGWRESRAPALGLQNRLHEDMDRLVNSPSPPSVCSSFSIHEHLAGKLEVPALCGRAVHHCIQPQASLATGHACEPSHDPETQLRLRLSAAVR